jgi:hypothetical protein
LPPRAAFGYWAGASVHGLPAASTVTADAPVRSVSGRCRHPMGDDVLGAVEERELGRRTELPIVLPAN